MFQTVFGCHLVFAMALAILSTGCKGSTSNPTDASQRDATTPTDADTPDADSGFVTDAGEDTGPIDSGVDKPVGASCTAGTQCSSTFCSDGVCCDSACAGTCDACTSALRGSGSDGTCGEIAMGMDPDSECADALSCSGIASFGCQLAQGAPCTDEEACGSGYCIDDVCCDGPCDSTCEACSAARGTGADGTCSGAQMGTDPGDLCVGELACTAAGVCELGNGQSCGAGSECDSGNCVDGVCCDTACAGTCEACTAAKKGAGSDGTCGFIVAGDPDLECVGGCNGAGACLL